eukprot:TRINITY_DN2397_c0_g1_i1.p1 TRINITY_DN2397_c0_g1~~TRINITY_DN2397_c0_g1_i1.p1  ORF type:complete len:1345 (+),score=381.94 TRINITY_DN2397_c0_g1_i1:90-4124(+)
MLGSRVSSPRSSFASDQTSPCIVASQPATPDCTSVGIKSVDSSYAERPPNDSFASLPSANDCRPPRGGGGSSGARRPVSRQGSVLGRTRSTSTLSRNLGRVQGRDRVRAVVRVRPFLHREREAARKAGVALEPSLTLDGDTATVVHPATGQREAFVFDQCFGAAATQDEVYAALGPPAVANALSGYNACILCYGQTNSGKTYTMLGSDATGASPLVGPRDGEEAAPPAADGMVSHILDDLFAAIDDDVSTTKLYAVTCSFMEIYCENVRDLLDTNHGAQFQEGLKVRNHPISGPFVEGLTSLQVTSKQHLLKLIAKGSRERISAQTQANERSSRSHAIVQVTLTQTEVWEEGVVGTTTSRLNLVDLAGSERLNTSHGAEDRASETASINLSLTTLRRVIDTLLENSRKQSSKVTKLPPYRESKLTWLLSESLGGNSRTVMVGAVSPHVAVAEETLNTLRYTLKAKGIVNMPTRNQGKHVAAIQSLKREIASLKDQLSVADPPPARPPPSGHYRNADTQTEKADPPSGCAWFATRPASHGGVASPQSHSVGSPWWSDFALPPMGAPQPATAATDYAVTVGAPLAECESRRSELLGCLGAAFGVTEDLLSDVTFAAVGEDGDGETVVSGQVRLPHTSAGVAAVAFRQTALQDHGILVQDVRTTAAATVRQALVRACGEGSPGATDVHVTLDESVGALQSTGRYAVLQEALCAALGVHEGQIGELALSEGPNGDGAVVSVQVTGADGHGVARYSPVPLAAQGFTPVGFQAVPCGAVQQAVGKVLQGDLLEQEQSQSQGHDATGAEQQGYLLAARRENAMQERRIVALQAEVQAWARADAGRQDTIKALHAELEAVCSSLRQKNRLNAELQGEADAALRDKAAAQRERDEAVAAHDNATRRSAEATALLQEKEKTIAHHEQRLRGLTVALEEKIDVTAQLEGDLARVRGQHLKLLKAVRDGAASSAALSLASPATATTATTRLVLTPLPTLPTPVGNESIVHTATDAGTPTPPDAASPHNPFIHSPSEQGAATVVRPAAAAGTPSEEPRLLDLDDDDSVLQSEDGGGDAGVLGVGWRRVFAEQLKTAEAKYEQERQCRARLGEERRKLMVERDQLTKETTKLIHLIEAKGYRVSGSGDGITLGKAAATEGSLPPGYFKRTAMMDVAADLPPFSDPSAPCEGRVSTASPPDDRAAVAKYRPVSVAGGHPVVFQLPGPPGAASTVPPGAASTVPRLDIFAAVATPTERSAAQMQGRRPPPRGGRASSAAPPSFSTAQKARRSGTPTRSSTTSSPRTSSPAGHRSSGARSPNSRGAAAIPASARQQANSLMRAGKRRPASPRPSRPSPVIV